MQEDPHSDPGSLHRNRTPCETASVGYSVICLNCKANNLLTTYEGETGRLANVRTSEHILDLEKKTRKKAHWLSTKFYIIRVKKHKKN